MSYAAEDFLCEVLKLGVTNLYLFQIMEKERNSSCAFWDEVN